MKIDNLNLVCHQNRYLLLDSMVNHPILLSKRAYDLLIQYKAGAEIEELKEKYGSEFASSLIEKVNAMSDSSGQSANQSFYTQAKSAVEQYLADDIDLLEGMIMVSQTCNLACRYCYGGESGSYHNRGLMGKEEARKWFQYLLAHGGNRPFQKVIFFGGEPLLNMEVIQYIVELWEQWKGDYQGKKVFFALTTNGLLLTDEIVRYFKEKKVNLTISLDGYREIHDKNRVTVDGSPTFDKVMEAIALLKKHDLPVTVRSTLTAGADIDRLYEFFETQNFDIHTLAIVDYPYVHPTEEYQVDLAKYKEFVRKESETVEQGCKDVVSENNNTFRAKQMSMSFQKAKAERPDYPFICGAGSWLVTFGIDGFIYPCNRLVGNPRFRIGDLHTGIDKARMARLLMDFTEGCRHCEGCWAVSMCKGRCFHQKLNDTGGFDDLPIELCDIYRGNYAETILFAHEMKEYVRQHKDKMDSAIVRFEADRMVEEMCREEYY